ncbi:hypothetical protein [Massilia oculi]|uniref:hypothetical protein n=1 Tax=Massilia oculi TaxID=945844 RepID=UPI001AAE4EEC|nr:hypothetical protein [Massilia oculi]
MKTWLKALAFSRRAQLVTREFTANVTLVIPAGVSSVGISGYGARGRDASQGSPTIREVRTIYATRRSTGVREVVSTSSRRVPFGGQIGYCDLVNETPTDPTYSSNQTCYGYDMYSDGGSSPPTTGASATGLGKTFPGSYGNTTPAATSFPNVPVTGGASYNIVVPAGGLVTVTYYL